MGITIRDVAKKLNLSITTVSRAWMAMLMYRRKHVS